MPTDRAGISGQPFNLSGIFSELDTSVQVWDSSSNRRLVVTKATFDVYTTSPKIVTLGDGTINVSFSGNNPGTHIMDFGPFGKKFTTATDVNLTVPSAGPAFTYAISGYIEGAWS